MVAWEQQTSLGRLSRIALRFHELRRYRLVISGWKGVMPSEYTVCTVAKVLRFDDTPTKPVAKPLSPLCRVA
jgi:hypothetical protein